MDETIDIYADLPSFDLTECGKCNETSKELTEKNAKFEQEVLLWKGKWETLELEKKNILTNTSSLIKTARAEINRKDRVIMELRRELEDLKFKRGIYSRGKKSSSESSDNKKRCDPRQKAEKLLNNRTILNDGPAAWKNGYRQNINEKRDPAQNLTDRQNYRDNYLPAQNNEWPQNREADLSTSIDPATSSLNPRNPEPQDTQETLNHDQSGSRTTYYEEEEDPEQIWEPEVKRQTVYGERLRRKLEAEQEAERKKKEDATISVRNDTKEQKNPMQEEIKKDPSVSLVVMSEYKTNESPEGPIEANRLSEHLTHTSNSGSLQNSEKDSKVRKCGDRRNDESLNLREGDRCRRDDFYGRRSNFDRESRHETARKSRSDHRSWHPRDSSGPSDHDRGNRKQNDIHQNHKTGDKRGKSNDSSRSKTPDRRHNDNKGYERNSQDKYRNNSKNREKSGADGLSRDKCNSTKYSITDSHDLRIKLHRKTIDEIGSRSDSDNYKNDDSDRTKRRKSRSPTEKSRSRSSQSDKRPSRRSRSRARDDKDEDRKESDGEKRKARKQGSKEHTIHSPERKGKNSPIRQSKSYEEAKDEKQKSKESKIVSPERNNADSQIIRSMSSNESNLKKRESKERKIVSLEENNPDSQILVSKGCKESNSEKRESKERKIVGSERNNADSQILQVKNSENLNIENQESKRRKIDSPSENNTDFHNLRSETSEKSNVEKEQTKNSKIVTLERKNADSQVIHSKSPEESTFEKRESNELKIVNSERNSTDSQILQSKNSEKSNFEKRESGERKTVSSEKNDADSQILQSKNSEKSNCEKRESEKRKIISSEKNNEDSQILQSKNSEKSNFEKQESGECKIVSSERNNADSQILQRKNSEKSNFDNRESKECKIVNSEENDADCQIFQSKNSEKSTFEKRDSEERRIVSSERNNADSQILQSKNCEESNFGKREFSRRNSSEKNDANSQVLPLKNSEKSNFEKRESKERKIVGSQKNNADSQILQSKNSEESNFGKRELGERKMVSSEKNDAEKSNFEKRDSEERKFVSSKRNNADSQILESKSSESSSPAIAENAASGEKPLGEQKVLQADLKTSTIEGNREVSIDNAKAVAECLTNLLTQVEAQDKFISMLENDSSILLSPLARRDVELNGSQSFREEKIENIEKYIQNFQFEDTHCTLLGNGETSEPDDENQASNSTSSIVDALSMDVEDVLDNKELKTEITENSKYSIGMVNQELKEKSVDKKLGDGEIHEKIKNVSTPRKLENLAIDKKKENPKADRESEKMNTHEKSEHIFADEPFEKKDTNKRLEDVLPLQIPGKVKVETETEVLAIDEKPKNSAADKKSDVLTDKKSDNNQSDPKTDDATIRNRCKNVTDKEGKDPAGERKLEDLNHDSKSRNTPNDSKSGGIPCNGTVEVVKNLEITTMGEIIKNVENGNGTKDSTIYEKFKRVDCDKNSQDKKSKSSATDKVQKSVSKDENFEDFGPESKSSVMIDHKSQDSVGKKLENFPIAIKVKDVTADKKLQNFSAHIKLSDIRFDRSIAAIFTDKKIQVVSTVKKSETVSVEAKPEVTVPKLEKKVAKISPPLPPFSELPPLPPLPPSSPPEGKEPKILTPQESLPTKPDVEKKGTDKILCKQTKKRPRIPILPIVSLYSRKRRNVVLTDSVVGCTEVKSKLEGTVMENGKKKLSNPRIIETQRESSPKPVKAMSSKLSEFQSGNTTTGRTMEVETKKAVENSLDGPKTLKPINSVSSKSGNASQKSSQPETPNSSTAATSKMEEKSRDEPVIVLPTSKEEGDASKQPTKFENKRKHNEPEVEPRKNENLSSYGKSSKTDNSKPSISSERKKRSALKTITSTASSTDAGPSSRKRPLSKEKENQSKPTKQAKIMIIARRRPVQLEDSSTATTLVSSQREGSSKDKISNGAGNIEATGRK